MELKRFVMINNNMIYDTENASDIKKYQMIKDGNKMAYGLKKTSDNILDLVEVGDLVRTTKGIFEIQFNMVDYGKVVAIYKRQANGDYKRYEVQHEI